MSGLEIKRRYLGLKNSINKDIYNLGFKHKGLKPGFKFNRSKEWIMV